MGTTAGVAKACPVATLSGKDQDEEAPTVRPQTSVPLVPGFLAPGGWSLAKRSP
ncbi:hypothetical protein AMTR_s00140p00107540 [Amborella trichopoda]|uniref:Uncharacterized protein n=1 Tax=Amborella trichopoda TaxID=13333 RepID=W1PAT9_AMBTC|nr:hypothetical protein AMTR_s00140p00107540 [Amborella trichopoda]